LKTKTNEIRKTYCGTPEYLAPEMLQRKGHDTSVDIWSVGILMFELLCGSSPFAAQNQEELFSNIRKHKIAWTNDFPPLAKTLISKILRPSPKDRLSLNEILAHTWFEQNPPNYKPLDMQSKDPKIILESHLLSVKPESVQEELNKIVEKINNLRMTRTTVAPVVTDSSPSTVNTQSKQGLLESNKNNFKLQEAQTKTSPLVDQQLASLLKENQDLKKRLELLQGEIAKSEQARLKDQVSIKQLELEKAELKNEIDRYILLNKDRINTLAELEEKTNKLIEYEFKVKLLESTNENHKENLNFNQKKFDEMKEVIVKLEEKNNNFKHKFLELSSSKEEVINEYQKKLELLQNKLLVGTSDSPSSDNYANVLEILNENITEFKKLFTTKINNLLVLLTDVKEELSTAEKSLKSNFDQKQYEVNDLMLKLTKRLEEEVGRFNNIEFIIQNNADTKKNQKEVWLSDQVHELQPYKSKFLNLEIKLKKSENEILLYKSKCDTLDDLYQESKKILESKNEEIKKKIMQIDGLESKLSDIKEFVYKECSTKLDEFHSMFKN